MLMMMMPVMKLSALANFCQMCEIEREGGQAAGWLYSMSNFTTCTIALTKAAEQREREREGAPSWSSSNGAAD